MIKTNKISFFSVDPIKLEKITNTKNVKDKKNKEKNLKTWQTQQATFFTQTEVEKTTIIVKPNKIKQKSTFSNLWILIKLKMYKGSQTRVKVYSHFSVSTNAVSININSKSNFISFGL